jgi:phosphoserine phosphatase RsbU/P
MGNLIASLLIDLIKTASVIIVFSYLITRSRFFSEILDRRYTIKNCLFAIVCFGILSVFGTYGGIALPSGAIANIRDMGPLVAGLFGGPIIGLGAGLIGGIQRYFAGGFVAVPCSSAPVIAGLLGGMIFLIRNKTFPRVWHVTLIAAGMELLHMGLTLLIARPFENALGVVESVIIPMTIANAAGSSIFAYIVLNLVNEKKTAAEKQKDYHKKKNLNWHPDNLPPERPTS